MDLNTVTNAMVELNTTGSVITDEETAEYIIQVLRGLKCAYRHSVYGSRSHWISLVD